LALPTPPSGSSAPVLHLDTSALQILGGSAASIFGSNPATPGSSPPPQSPQSAQSDHPMMSSSGGGPSPVPFGLSVQIPAASADIASPYGSAISDYMSSASMCSSPNDTDFDYDSSSNSNSHASYYCGGSAVAAAVPSAAAGAAAAAGTAGAYLPKRGGRVGPTRTRTKSARAAAAAASSRLQSQIQQEEDDFSSSSAGGGVGGGTPRGGGKRTSRKKASPSHQPRDAESATPLPEYTGPLPNSYWELNEAMIASISYKDFTTIVLKSKLTAKQVADAKKVRRRVKNRHSARLCSTRRRDKCQSTEDINQALVDRLTKSQSDNALLIDQIAALKEVVQDMEKGKAEAIREKVAVQAELNRIKRELEKYSK